MEIGKVFDFWSSRPNLKDLPENKIVKIILCGQGANNKELVEKLMSESGVPYALADVWQNASRRERLVGKASPGESLEYASAIGLVLPKIGKKK
jgi:hypothetical protein